MARPRILLIDDEEDLLLAVSERLRLRGFQVETASDGADALDLVTPGRFDAIVLDIRMPGLDAAELMARIRDEDPQTRFVLCTGDDALADSKLRQEPGVVGCFLKPLNLTELAEKLRELGRE